MTPSRNPSQAPEASFAVGSGEGALGLTSVQHEALAWLKAKRDATPLTRWSYGFNPPSGRRAETAAMRGSLARRGFIRVDRVSDRHFRYEITAEGRAALARDSREPCP